MLFRQRFKQFFRQHAFDIHTIRIMPLSLAIYLSCITSNAHSLNQAIEQQLKKSVEQDVQQFIHSLPHARYELKVRSLSRKTLASCPQKITISPLAKHKPPMGLVKRKLSCSGLWQVTGTVAVSIFIQVMHSAKKLTRGARIGSEDLSLREIPYHHARQKYYTSADHLIGRTLKRTVPHHRIINQNMLEPNYIIKKGDRVMIRATANDLKVSMPGIALSHGALSDSIPVQNRSSGKIIDAVVLGAGKVGVSF